MRVYLMRHATAQEPGSGPDAARPLTEQGRREARDAGDALRDRKAAVTAILSSPRTRARETAELVASALGGGVTVQLRERLTCGSTAALYLDEIRSVKAGEVLLVAHNPELSAFASALVCEAVSFSPSTICAVDLESDDARLVWLRHPKS
jgi:phosphohistidine phosphatase